MVVLVLLRGQHPISPLVAVKPNFGTPNQKFTKLFVECTGLPDQLGSSQRSGGNPLGQSGRPEERLWEQKRKPKKRESNPSSFLCISNCLLSSRIQVHTLPWGAPSVGNLELCSFRCCCMSVLLVISYTCELDPTTSARVRRCSSVIHSLVPWAGNDVF